MSYQKRDEFHKKPFRCIRNEEAQKQRERESREELMHTEEFPESMLDQQRKRTDVY